MRIQEAARQLGVSPRVLRHYEAEGLISPRRSANGYRIYSPKELMQAEWVRDLVASGFSTRELRNLLSALDDGPGKPSIDCTMLMREKLDQIDRLLAALRKRRGTLTRRLEAWKQQSSEGTRNENTQHLGEAVSAARRTG